MSSAQSLSIVSGLLIAFAFVLPQTVAAQAIAPTLTVGSANIATADPFVSRPTTTPCAVTLFANQAFGDFSPKPFNYTPPAACPGPWQKVVMTVDYSINGTRQYDRTADIWLGGAIIYFGTTSEPSVIRAGDMSWHIERDMTDYSALFAQVQSGHADLGNVYNSTYNGLITGTATLYFYPAVDTGSLQPRPDQIVPIGAADLSTGQQLSATVTLPTNVERAFLDVYPQGQSGNEEFWYSNLPDDLAPAYGVGGSTAFREGQVTIDGQPAGIVPIYPWIFTGADGPAMWQPIPGVQTLAFEAYRVDLTPFAGLLDDGNPHTIAVGIYNVTSYFTTAANLLVYLDHGASRLQGSLTTNTLNLTPNVNVVENYANNQGSVTVTANRQYTIAGHLHTSHGDVHTQIDANIGFSNVQQLVSTDTQFNQDVSQLTTIDVTTSRNGGGTPYVVHERRNYPLVFNTDYSVADDGSSAYAIAIDQDFQQQLGAGLNRNRLQTAQRDSHMKTSGVLRFDASGNYLGSSQTGTPSHSYTYSDPSGACYSRSIVAQAYKLISVTDGSGCANGVNVLPWLDVFTQGASQQAGSTVQLLP